MAEKERAGLLDRFISWREKYIAQSQFILILSFIVGVLSALAAFALKHLIHFIQHLLTGGFDAHTFNWLYLVYPVIGIFITGLFIRKVVRDDISHGVTKVLYAISCRQGKIRHHNSWSSLIASGITIGFGGSVGAESPIVMTGSAIGSNLGSLFKMEKKVMMLLIGCGAAGAVSGIFKAPIAGLVFTVEVLMLDLTMSSLLPLLISSVTAATLSYILMGTEAMFEFHLENTFDLARVPYVILLGIVCGLVSLYFTHVTTAIEKQFKKLSNPYVKLAIGGSVLSVLIFLFPPLYGEGYDTITALINGASENIILDNSLFYGHAKYILIYMFFIIVFKAFASTVTNCGGGCGGIFAPSLFLGCVSGYLFASLCNMSGFGVEVSDKNFALFGMAALMSGVFHAPLTGVFLIAELTGGYALFLPLMIVSVFSYLTVKLFDKNNIYAIRLAQRGELITHHKDQAVLTILKVSDVIEKDFMKLTPDMDLGALTSVVAKTKRNIFPVLDAGNRLVGILYLDDIRHIMFRQELYHRYTVAVLMRQVPERLSIEEPMEAVMRKFEDTGAWNLPVEDIKGEYIGFISKSAIFTAYRKTLLEFTSD
ncbi:MAG: CBS domain-containing protein [Bacteroidales bacterium]|nr:CBS domain-containing protein [Bacteroidales bacterium]